MDHITHLATVDPEAIFLELWSEKRKVGQKSRKWVRKVESVSEKQKRVKKKQKQVRQAERVRKAESGSEKQKVGQKSRKWVRKYKYYITPISAKLGRKKFDKTKIV